MNEDQKQSVAPATKTPASTDTKPTEPVKTPDTVKPQTTQPSVAVKTTEPAKTQAVQSTATVKAPDTVKPQPTGNTVSTVSAPTKTTEPAKPQSTAPTAPATVKEPEPVKPQTVQPTETAQEPVKPQITQPTEVPKLSDVIPTSKVWISGLIGNRQIDCLGPIEIPLKIDEPTYPFTPVPSNPDYTNQVFDYDTSTWVPTDAKSQGQQLTDLTKAVIDLQQASIKYDKTAEQAQQMSVQQMQTLMTIDAKLDALTKKEGIK